MTYKTYLHDRLFALIFFCIVLWLIELIWFWPLSDQIESLAFAVISVPVGVFFLSVFHYLSLREQIECKEREQQLKEQRQAVRREYQELVTRLRLVADDQPEAYLRFITDKLELWLRADPELLGGVFGWSTSPGEVIDGFLHPDQFYELDGDAKRLLGENFLDE